LATNTGVSAVQERLSAGSHKLLISNNTFLLTSNFKLRGRSLVVTHE